MPFELLPLTEDARSATQGHSGYHSTLFRQECSPYHQGGYLWRPQRLERFFNEGLLQHYLSTLSGYDLVYGYTDNLTYFQNHPSRCRQYDVNKYKKLFSYFGLNSQSLTRETLAETPDLRQQIKKVHLTSQKYFALIKDIPVLSVLGGEYQRLKQLAEQYSHKMRIDDGFRTEKNQGELYAIDRVMEHCQFLVFNLMRFYLYEMKQYISEHVDLSQEFDQKRLIEFKENIKLKMTEAVSQWQEDVALYIDIEALLTQSKANQQPKISLSAFFSKPRLNPTDLLILKSSGLDFIDNIISRFKKITIESAAHMESLQLCIKQLKVFAGLWQESLHTNFEATEQGVLAAMNTTDLNIGDVNLGHYLTEQIGFGQAQQPAIQLESV